MNNQTTNTTATAPKTAANDDYVEAAARYLKPEAAARYAAGDMDATDDIGHDAISKIASEVCAERLAMVDNGVVCRT